MFPPTGSLLKLRPATIEVGNFSHIPIDEAGDVALDPREPGLFLVAASHQSGVL